MKSEDGGPKGSPTGELAPQATERFLPLTKSKEHGDSRAVTLAKQKYAAKQIK